LHEQGQDMVIVPLESAFGAKSSSDQQQIIQELQMHSRAAGLKGTVVTVWEISGGMSFIAPTPWHPFFKGLTMRAIFMNINKEISW
jgi:hypothetical protein